MTKLFMRLGKNKIWVRLVHLIFKNLKNKFFNLLIDNFETNNVKSYDLYKSNKFTKYLEFFSNYNFYYTYSKTINVLIKFFLIKNKNFQNQNLITLSSKFKIIKVLICNVIF